MLKKLLIALSTAVAALVLGSGTALASGGSYTFVGGTPIQQYQVRAALNASAFPWGIVRDPVRIHISQRFDWADASKGNIWLGGRLLDAGMFSWGTIQHEYAHEVDLSLFDDTDRAFLQRKLGGLSYWEAPGVAHGDLTCERFASTLAWSYWQSDSNIMKPRGPHDESAAMAPAKFRSLMTSMLGVPGTTSKKK